MGLAVSGRKAELVERLLAARSTAAVIDDASVARVLPPAQPQAAAASRRTRLRAKNSGDDAAAMDVEAAGGLNAVTASLALDGIEAAQQIGTASKRGTSGAEESLVIDSFLDEMLSSMGVDDFLEIQVARKKLAKTKTSSRLRGVSLERPSDSSMRSDSQRNDAADRGAAAVTVEMKHEVVEGQQLHCNAKGALAKAVVEAVAAVPDPRTSTRISKPQASDWNSEPSTATTGGTRLDTSDLPSTPSLSTSPSQATSTRSPEQIPQQDVDRCPEYDLPPWPPL